MRVPRLPVSAGGSTGEHLPPLSPRTRPPAVPSSRPRVAPVISAFLIAVLLAACAPGCRSPKTTATFEPTASGGVAVAMDGRGTAQAKRGELQASIDTAGRSSWFSDVLKLLTLKFLGDVDDD